MFSSEKDGWAHLYSISAGGGALTALTPGNYEVENATLSPDKSFVIFSANKNDIDRRHLWRVNVTGGEPEQITKGDGIEMSPRLFDNGRRIALFHSTARSISSLYRLDRRVQSEASGAASSAARLSLREAGHA
jgi:Tol biopolymer transport system component